MTIHALQGGGAEWVFCQLARRWAEAGHEVHVVTWSAVDGDPAALGPNITRHGLDLLRPSSNAWQALLANWRRLRKLRATLGNLNPEVVLSFCDQMNISTLRATRGLRLPVWIAERSDPSKQQLSPWWELGRRQNYPRCTGCLVQTKQIAKHLSQLIPPERLFVIPNAVNAPLLTSDCASDPQEASQHRGFNSSKIVLSVGRLSREKGIDVLLAAWREAQPQLDGWQLHVAGDGPQRATLEAQCTDLPSVKFLGWLADPATEYATSALFVLPSRYEGFPNALLEAMSHGLPCIATRCSQAVDELSQAGSAVRMVAVESPSQLAAAIMELGRATERRRQLSQSAKRVSQEYAWSRIGPLWDRVLTS